MTKPAEHSKPASQGENFKVSRSFRNFALQPLLQVKLGLYSILLSLAFALTISGILYFNLSTFMSIVLQLTGVEEEVADLLNQYINPVKYQIGISLVCYVIINIVVTIIFTHRLIGPTVAFRRHIRMIADGNFHYRTILRKGDAFSEVADDLNKLSVLLEQKSKGSS